jgi:hypothetical protein
MKNSDIEIPVIRRKLAQFALYLYTLNSFTWLYFLVPIGLFLFAQESFPVTIFPMAVLIGFVVMEYGSRVDKNNNWGRSCNIFPDCRSFCGLSSICRVSISIYHRSTPSIILYIGVPNLSVATKCTIRSRKLFALV